MTDDKTIEKLNTGKKIIEQKILIIGDSKVDISSFISKVFNLPFNKKEGEVLYDSTNISFNIELNDYIINYEISHTSNENEIPIIISDLAEKLSLVIIVYSIENEKSFNNLKNLFCLIKGINDMNKIIIIGNKTNLHYHKAFSKEKLEEFFKTNGIKTYLEISTEDKKSVEELAELINDIAVKRFELNESKKFENEKNDEKGTSCGCC